ncbi:MAG TPA: glycosyltransferase family 2 protein [Acidimicrobiales bacterium]|nr:glycosyltransferase family 2 protein [Acidimicrobiales bacterium]
MVRASVVICAYTEERWALLVRSVESVLHQERAPLEVIVCIDHNDALLERCRREWPASRDDAPIPVVVIANKYEGRLGSARNSAAEITHGDIVVFLDDDARADPDWLDRLLAPYDDERVVAVGGAPLPEFERERPGWFPVEFDWVFGCAYDGLPETRAIQARLIGANMSVRRTALAAIGGFHSDNHDDMDMCHRLAHVFPDEHIVYEPTARVRHHVPRARTTWHYFWRRCFFVNKGKVEAFRQMEEAASLSADVGFASRALTRGVPRALGQAFRGDPSGVGRAGAIVAGVALAGAGHLAGQGSLRARQRRARPHVRRAVSPQMEMPPPLPRNHPRPARRGRGTAKRRDWLR